MHSTPDFDSLAAAHAGATADARIAAQVREALLATPEFAEQRRQAEAQAAAERRARIETLAQLRDEQSRAAAAVAAARAEHEALDRVVLEARNAVARHYADVLQPANNREFGVQSRIGQLERELLRAPWPKFDEAVAAIGNPKREAETVLAKFGPEPQPEHPAAASVDRFRRQLTQWRDQVAAFVKPRRAGAVDVVARVREIRLASATEAEALERLRRALREGGLEAQ